MLQASSWWVSDLACELVHFNESVCMPIAQVRSSSTWKRGSNRNGCILMRALLTSCTKGYSKEAIAAVSFTLAMLHFDRVCGVAYR